MKPLEIAAEHNTLLGGRPMWLSLLSVDDSPHPEPSHVDPDDSHHQEEIDLVRKRKARSFANLDFVLEKLLVPHHPKACQWKKKRLPGTGSYGTVSLQVPSSLSFPQYRASLCRGDFGDWPRHAACEPSAHCLGTAAL